MCLAAIFSGRWDDGITGDAVGPDEILTEENPKEKIKERSIVVKPYFCDYRSVNVPFSLFQASSVELVELLREVHEGIEQLDVMINYSSEWREYSHSQWQWDSLKVLDCTNTMDQFLCLNEDEQWTEETIQWWIISPNQISTNMLIALVTLTKIRGNSCNEEKSRTLMFAFDCNWLAYLGIRRKT